MSHEEPDWSGLVATVSPRRLLEWMQYPVDEPEVDEPGLRPDGEALRASRHSRLRHKSRFYWPY